MRMKIIELIATYIVDTVFPPDPDVRKIELMQPDTFLKEALKVPKIQGIPDVIHFLPYRGGVTKTAIVEVKNHENKKVARLLGSLLYDFLYSEITDLEFFGNFKSPLILPIPITNKKKRQRGWNQCELILNALDKFNNSRIFEIRSDILIKIRENDDQVGKSRIERFKNLKNCFVVNNKEALKGRCVIIFDDIVTTGATLTEAKKTLLLAGAYKVVCIALAH